MAEYTETREVNVDASGADLLELVTGAGTLIVEGVAGLDTVEVDAQIVVDVISDSKGKKLAEEKAKLELDRSGGKIRLTAEPGKMHAFASDGVSLKHL